MDIKELLGNHKPLSDMILKNLSQRDPDLFNNPRELLTASMLGLHVEVSELAQATRCFKYWSNKPSESKERVLDEYVDVLHMMACIAEQLEFTAEDIEKAYLKKNEVNYSRQESGY
jgi:dimeric dUTPase (all-alpha-NTP-PPase superfamily)